MYLKLVVESWTDIKHAKSDRMKEFPGYHETVLPPLDEDVERLRKIDLDFVRNYLHCDTDTKSSAVASADVDEESCQEDKKPAARVSVDPNLAQAVAELIGTGVRSILAWLCVYCSWRRSYYIPKLDWFVGFPFEPQ